ncbi:MAG: CHAT domain-containing protein [Flavobacterium sp.]|uniref:CHAT domain-containing protein n=1 Tax=Flavobacterium sp. TaxID=239 RepID=UPI0022C81BA8|nr:CHAT domain-containing protein [Flavobacterium sp.]MCZ8196144.1 CHAT domain-containing protein [Flavobacterium sp.]
MMEVGSWKKIVLLFLLVQFAFSQSNKTLENKIYETVEVFAANPTIESLNKIEIAEKSFVVKSNTEKLALVILKCNVAFYQNQFGQTQKAISSYEKAWQLYDQNKLSNYDIVESCLKPLGNLYTIVGDYDNAENTIKQYFYIASIDKNSKQKAAAILNLSNVYQNTGKIDEAIILLEKTIKTEKLSSTEKGKLLSNLGNNYFLSKNYKKAENAFELSVVELKKVDSQSEMLFNSYRNLASLYLENNPSKAINYLEKASAIFSKIENIEPRKKASFLLVEAKMLFSQEKFQEAKKKISDVFKLLLPNYSKTILPSKNALYAETILLDALDLQATLFVAENQPKKALESYALSFHVEELLQSLLMHENSKIINQIRNRNRTEKCIAIYYSLFRKENKISYLEKAFELQEKTKSAVLQQEIAKNKVISKEEKLIYEQLQNWKNTILKEQQNLEYADISKINEAIKKQNELMLLLKSKQSNPIEKEKSFKISELYSKLENDKAVMIEYFFGQEKIYIFTIQNNKIKLEEINFEATSKIISFLNYFSNAEKITNDVASFNRDAFSVYKMLKLPSKSTNKNLIIVPDGILNFLPFETLITKESKTTNFAKMHYLLNDFAVGYNNSATFYLNVIPFKHDKETILGVFPVFENSTLELAFSKKEMQSIKKNFKGTYLEKQNATFKNFSSNATNFSILHLSTHASSGDVIEPASIRFYEQEIMYSELYHLNINPDLVVLSACETGIGKLYNAEGAMSVARGFQFAGAQNLLFSLWKVNDFTTSVFMEKFYKNIQNGKSYFEANHQAKLDFLKSSRIPNAKKSPYYWSAFVYYGTLENKESTNYFLWISIVVGIVGLVFLFLFFRKNFNKNKNIVNLV